MSSSSARSTTRLSTRTGSSSSASSASAAASSPLARTGSIPKQRGEKYFIVLKAKGPEGAPRHCLFIVLARHDQLEPFVKGFSTSCFNGTGFFAYKGLKYIADAETYACDAAAALYEGATPEDAKAALGALGPRRYIRIDDFASMLGRGENGALAAVKAAVALRNAVDISADDEPEPGPEGGAGSQTEDDDVEDEPPASPLTSTSPRRARAAAAVATVTPAGDGTRGTRAARVLAGEGRERRRRGAVGRRSGCARSQRVQVGARRPLFLSGVLLFCIDAAAGRGSSTSTLPFVPFPPVDHGRPLRRCPRPPFVVLGVESAWSSRSSCLPGAGALVLNLPRSTASSLSVV